MAWQLKYSTYLMLWKKRQKVLLANIWHQKNWAIFKPLKKCLNLHLSISSFGWWFNIIMFTINWQILYHRNYGDIKWLIQSRSYWPWHTLPDHDWSGSDCKFIIMGNDQFQCQYLLKCANTLQNAERKSTSLKHTVVSTFKHRLIQPN